MPDKLRAILQPHRITILIILAVITVSLLLFWASQAANKTIWDYLEKLIIPAVLGAIAWLFNRAAKERDRWIANDRQRQETLRTYFDRLSDLLLNQEPGLRDAENKDEIRTVARARTLSVFRSLDGERKGRVLQFLYEGGLITGKKPVIVLAGADLKGANLKGAHLDNAEMTGANLSVAIPQRTLWQHSDSQITISKKKYPIRTNLTGAFLSHAILKGANLVGAECNGAIFLSTVLEEANLECAFLSDAHLYSANLKGANLKSAILLGADLRSAILERANLKGALLRLKELRKLMSLEKATMPNGMKYEEWIAKRKPDWSKGTAKQQADEPEENDSESEDEV